MEKPLRVLIVEDSEDDALLILRELKKGGYDPVYERVDTALAMRTVLREKAWDIILCDYQLPQFNGPAAIAVLKETGIDIPLIIVSGAIGEETAADCMRFGAQDFAMKGNLSRLVPAIEREWKEAESRIKRRQAEEALKKKNEELRDMTQQLWQAAKLATMGELSASIAHELNNPLTTVTLRVESLLEKIPEDNPNHRALKIIEQEVQRMSRLIADLLQFSRRDQPQISTVDVCEEIEKTLDLVHYHLRKNGISILRQFADNVPKIHADRQQLRQLFLNLFTNAADAMPYGGMLTLRVSAVLENKQIRIEVIDTGTGIATENLSKVTEPFYTTKPEGKGTGLGLAICRRVAQAHHGTIEITSDAVPGKGTRVCLTLPFTDSSTVDYLCE